MVKKEFVLETSLLQLRVFLSLLGAFSWLVFVALSFFVFISAADAKGIIMLENEMKATSVSKPEFETKIGNQTTRS